MTAGMLEPSIGRRIAAFRRARGFRTARELSGAIPNGLVSEAVIQNIEAGRKADLSVSQLINISRALRVSPVFLLAPLAKPDSQLDLPGLSEDAASMRVAEFDAWVSGVPFGRYRGRPDEEREREQLELQREVFSLNSARGSLATSIAPLLDELDRETDPDNRAMLEARIEDREMRVREMTAKIDDVEGRLIQSGWYEPEA